MFENDYTINGKHATYLKFLAKKNARDDQSPDIGPGFQQLGQREAKDLPRSGKGFKLHEDAPLRPSQRRSHAAKVREGRR